MRVREKRGERDGVKERGIERESDGDDALQRKVGESWSGGGG